MCIRDRDSMAYKKLGGFVCKFFFFKQKTAYEIGVRLVGSEMCIRDRIHPVLWQPQLWQTR